MSRLKQWLPMALCCVPGLAIAMLVATSVLLGGASIGVGLGGPLQLGLLALALLVCPVGMGLLMWLNLRSAPADTINSMACCAPAEDNTSSPERLAQLVARREALERELAASLDER